MKNSGSKISGYALAVLAFLCIQVSCINQDYDMKKVVSGESTLFENISLPVGNIEKISISEILSFEDAPYLHKDSSGDYYLNILSDSQSSSFTIPDILMQEEVKFEDIIVNFSTGVFGGIDVSKLPDTKISYSSLNSNRLLDTFMPINIDAKLPSEIKGIKDVSLDTHLMCNFEVNGALYVSEGFQMIFPDYIYLSKDCETADYEIINEHILQFRSDTRIDADHPLVLTLDFSRISVPEGSIEGSIFHVEDEVEIKGDFYIMTSDYPSIPNTIRFVMHLSMNELSINSAEVKLDVDMDVPEDEIIISGIPELLKGDGICADIYNPQISMKISNSTPLSFSINAEIGSDEVAEAVRITQEDGVHVDADAVSTYLISNHPVSVPSGTVNIVKPQLGEIVRILPEKLYISEFNIITSDEYVTLETGVEYKAEVEYDLTMPLSFGDRLYLSFEQNIENLSLNAMLKSVLFEMDMVNTIPVDFDLKAVCIDEYGNEVSGTKVEMDKTIAAGSHESPTVTPLVLRISNDAGKINIDGLKLKLTAKAGDKKFTGINLNENQGLEIRNISMTLPDGIGLEIK